MRRDYVEPTTSSTSPRRTTGARRALRTSRGRGWRRQSSSKRWGGSVTGRGRRSAGARQGTEAAHEANSGFIRPPLVKAGEAENWNRPQRMEIDGDSQLLEVSMGRTTPRRRVFR